LLFQFFQSFVHLPLSFAKASQMVIQADVRLATTTHDGFTVTNLAEKWPCPEIAAWAMDVNVLTVEIKCHFGLPFWTAGMTRMRSNNLSAGSS
jgi:hypothetical protein